MCLFRTLDIKRVKKISKIPSGSTLWEKMSLNLSKEWEKRDFLKFVKFRCINKNYTNWVFIFSFRFFPWSFQHLINGNKFRFELFYDKGKRFNIIEKLIFDKNSKIIVSIIYFTIKMRAALSYDKIIRYKFKFRVRKKDFFYLHYG